MRRRARGASPRVARARARSLLAPPTTLAGAIDCLVKTATAEGPLALYKGFTPAYMRLAPWQCVFFITFEAINKVASVAQL